MPKNLRNGHPSTKASIEVEIAHLRVIGIEIDLVTQDGDERRIESVERQQQPLSQSDLRIRTHDVVEFHAEPFAVAERRNRGTAAGSESVGF